MSSAGEEAEVVNDIELVESNGREAVPPSVIVDVTVEEAEVEISPLLPEIRGRRKLSIFSVSGPRSRRRLMKESILGNPETEVNMLFKMIFGIWSSSRYSGLLCVASSSIIYYIMDVFTDNVSGREIPLFEVVLLRCIILSILSVVWLRSTGKKVFETRRSRNLLLLRAITGCLSLLCFIYSVQNLPLSYALLANFSTPLMASISARIILREKLAIIDIGGLLCGFIGILFMVRPELLMIGGSNETVEFSTTGENNYLYPVLVGMLSSVAAGISYCLIRAATTDHPVSSVLAFGVVAIPVSVVFLVRFQEFVVPGVMTFLLMILLGVLAFFAEVLLARGLQLERINRATTVQYLEVQYLEVLLSQIWTISLSRSSLSFSKLVGCLLIFASSGSTLYSKRVERETETAS